jgi:hypothetical protein
MTPAPEAARIETGAGPADSTDEPAVAASRAAVTDLPAPPVESRPLALRGRVTDPDGTPVAAAQVSVAGVGTDAVSDSDGAFALDIPPSVRSGVDSLRIAAERPGFGSAEIEIGTTANDSIWADLRLEPMAVGRPVGTTWVLVDPEEASRSFGAPILLIPDLPVVEIGFGRLDGARAVRVIQEHPGGRLTFVQVRGAESVEPGAAASASGTVSSVVEGIRVTGAGPLSADSIRGLLERLR